MQSPSGLFTQILLAEADRRRKAIGLFLACTFALMAMASLPLGRVLRSPSLERVLGGLAGAGQAIAHPWTSPVASFAGLGPGRRFSLPLFGLLPPVTVRFGSPGSPSPVPNHQGSGGTPIPSSPGGPSIGHCVDRCTAVDRAERQLRRDVAELNDAKRNLQSKMRGAGDAPPRVQRALASRREALAGRIAELRDRKRALRRFESHHPDKPGRGRGHHRH
jgi:hypothetical protein